MVKLIWLLKRADHLSLAEFRDWWLNRHAHDVAAYQRQYLRRYTVSVREDADTLAGRPAAEPEWDGIAEQWFDSEADVNACYGRPDSPTRADTLAHVSRFQRLLVHEHAIAIPPPQDGQP